MTTINSLSGGKTSAYIAVHYPADYELFSLVRTSDPLCAFPDKKVQQMVSDRLGVEFIGTLEQDEIIYTMLDLEQFIGREITWITGPTFDEVIKNHSTVTAKYLPNVMQRFCTTDMKVTPIKEWCYNNTELPIEMRIGFRANELRRAENMIKREKEDGLQYDRFVVDVLPSGRRKWKELPYRKVTFPLIDAGLFKDSIEEYWKDKPVRFAYMNNCVGCFHRNELLLKHMSVREPNKFDWFARQEDGKAQFKKEISYEKIQGHRMQFDLFDEDFNDCDSGYCGL